MGKFEGFEINGHWVLASTIASDYHCRRCGARVGRPYADPASGELDFERIVCAGPDEHEIRGPSDLVHENLVEWLDQKAIGDAEEVLVDYPWLDHRPKPDPDDASKRLYGDPDFEGFG